MIGIVFSYISYGRVQEQPKNNDENVYWFYAIGKEELAYTLR